MSVYIQKFLNKDIPFSGQLGLPIMASSFGYQVIRIRGRMLETPNSSFFMSLQSGGSCDSMDDSVLYLKVESFPKPRLSFNTFANLWAREEECCEKAIRPGEDFEIAIMCEHRLYKIYVDGVFIHRFNHRYPPERVSHVVIDGDVILKGVERELPGDCSSVLALIQYSVSSSSVQ